MLLSSPEVGSENVIGVAEENSIYLVRDKTENQDITFVNVLNPSDGGNYYIPISDSIDIISFDSLNNNGGEV